MGSSSIGMEPSCKVFAICGPPGSGKTTLCKALSCIIPHSHYICMDDYQQMTSWTDSQLAMWLESGSDYSKLPAPGLLKELYRLKYSRSDTITQDISRFTPIFFESHLGKHLGSSSIIDYVVWIDTSLDISLARAVRGIFCEETSGSSEIEHLNSKSLGSYLDQYVHRTAMLLRMQSNRIRPTADLIVTKHSNESIADWVEGLCRV